MTRKKEFTAHQSLQDQAKENKRLAHSARERQVQEGYRHARETVKARHMRRFAGPAMLALFTIAAAAAFAYGNFSHF